MGENLFVSVGSWDTSIPLRLGRHKRSRPNLEVLLQHDLILINVIHHLSRRLPSSHSYKYTRTQPRWLVNHMLTQIYRGPGIYGVKGSGPILFSKLHHRGERGRKVRECKFRKIAHRTFDPINSWPPVVWLILIWPTVQAAAAGYLHRFVRHIS